MTGARANTFWPAWACWTLAQLAALGVLAMRVPLAANMPAPIEQWSAVGVAAVQLIGAALLLPALLTSVTRCVQTLAAAAPILVLSTLLAGFTLPQATPAIMIALFWLSAFAAMTYLVRPRSAQSITMLLSVGGIAISYARAEYNSGPSTLFAFASETIFPVVGFTSTLSHHGWIWSSFSLPVTLLATAGLKKISTTKNKKLSPLHLTA